MPPSCPPSFWRSRWAVAAGVLVLAYGVFDPASFPFPRCPFHTLTGLWCAGCGGQRALHALLHADVPGALRYNALFVGALPLALWAGRRPPPRPTGGYLRSRWLWALVGLTVLFTVARNVPAFALLAPPGG